MIKDWPGGSYMVFKSKTIVTGDTLLVDIEYKYNSWKVIYIITTEVSYITTPGIPYSSN